MVVSMIKKCHVFINTDIMAIVIIVYYSKLLHTIYET